MEDFSNIKKVCGFYVSNIHLATMILPYINKQIHRNIKIGTILEYNLKEDINRILSKLVINKKEKEKILSINWGNTKIEKYNNMEEKLNEILRSDKKMDILVSGSRKYIEEANKVIEKFINKNESKIKREKITIINCYEVTEFDDNIREILDSHQFIINTSGIHKIEDIFEDYKKKAAN